MKVVKNEKGMKGGVEMKTSNKVCLVLLVCLGVAFFAANVRAAEQSQPVTQELVSGLGIPADVAGTLVSGPDVGFGQRLQQAVKNGGITQQQHDAIINRFMQLPQKQREAMKLNFDQGQGIPIAKIMNKPQAAEQSQPVTQELVSGLGIPADVASTLESGQGTFGERIEAALANGAITQKQYDAVVNRFLALDQTKRGQIKGAWDRGKGVNAEALHNVLNPQDPASVRDHAHALALVQEGYTPAEIKSRLINEGVDPAKVEAIISGAAQTPNRVEHAKEIRDTGTNPKAVDAAHARIQNMKAPANRVGHLKDVNPEKAKAIRDNRSVPARRR